MNYTIFKMRFKAAVHICDKSLTDSEMTIHADTVFSALCHEALKSNEGELESLFHFQKRKHNHIRRTALYYRLLHSKANNSY